MRHAAHVTFALAAALALLGCGAAATTTARPSFDTTHVTLYDCGLAQIERQADVTGASTLEIDVEQAHLDDLLASLVLATDGSVKVSGVKFPGVQNLGQAVASSGFANSMLDGSGGLEMPADLLGYARAMVGTSVTITAQDGKTMKGTVLDAVQPEGPPDEQGNPTPGEPLMVVVSPQGGLVWIPVSEIQEMAPVSQLEASSLKNFAAALGKAKGFNETTLKLETTKDSEGLLAAAYVRQIPVWRMLYKTTVTDGKVVLEAWAVVHNDTPEDWTDVSMTLVSGLPSSYVTSLASPRYTHRETVEAPGPLGEMMPQLGASTPDTLLYEWDVYHEDAFGYSLGYGGGSGYGYGAGGMGSIGTIGHGGGYGETSSSLLKVGAAAAEETMYAEVEQEISTYTAMSKVSLPSGGTSLVPLIRRELPGEAFTMLSPGMEPTTCVRVENVTGLVLQPGMASFYTDGRFRGQDEIDRLEPGDIRVLCYGADQDLAFTRAVDVDNVYTALEWKHDSLWVHNLRTTDMHYEIENFAGQPRDLTIEITHIENGRVVTPTKLLETDLPTRWLHPLSIEPRSELEKKVVVEEGVMSQVQLRVSRFDLLLEAGTLPKEQTKVLEQAHAILLDKEKLDDEVTEMSKSIAELEETITWQKDLLAAVPQTGGKSKSVDTILAEIMQAQKKIKALRADIEDVQEKSEALVDKAKSVLEPLRPAPKD